jgi:hypothetical protein
VLGSVRNEKRTFGNADIGRDEQPSIEALGDRSYGHSRGEVELRKLNGERGCGEGRGGAQAERDVDDPVRGLVWSVGERLTRLVDL